MSKRAITKIQGIVIAVIIIVALIAGVAIYLSTRIVPPSPPSESPEEIAKREIEEYVRKANIDWKQCAGESIYLLLVRHTYTESLMPWIPLFENLTGIKVSYDMYTEEEYWTKINTILSTGSSAVDVFMSGNLLTMQEYASGWIEPLDIYLYDPKLTDLEWYNVSDFPSSLWNQAWWNGTWGFIGKDPWAHLLRIPVQQESYIIIYRKDLFSKYGLNIDPVKSLTWEELYSLLGDFKKGLERDNIDIIPYAVRGIRGVTFAWTSFICCVRSYGGGDAVLIPDPQNPGKSVPWPIVNSRPDVDAIYIYGKLLLEYGPKAWSTYHWFDLQDGFSAGKIAMYIDCDFCAFANENPAESVVAGKIGYATVPRGPTGGFGSNWWDWSLAMSRFSKHKKAAWLFMEFATCSKVLKYSTLLYRNAMPTRLSVINDPEVRAMMPEDFWKAVEYNWEHLYLGWVPAATIFTIADTWIGYTHEALSSSPFTRDVVQQKMDQCETALIDVYRNGGDLPTYVNEDYAMKQIKTLYPNLYP